MIPFAMEKNAQSINAYGIYQETINNSGNGCVEHIVLCMAISTPMLLGFNHWDFRQQGN